MKYFVFLLIILWGCSSAVDENYQIKDSKINITIVEPDNTILWQHLYLESAGRKYGFLCANSMKNTLSLSIMPGVYDVDVYGIKSKSASAMMTGSYRVIHGIDLTCDRNITLDTISTSVNMSAVRSADKASCDVKIVKDELFEILSLSSISIKQGGLGYKSVTDLVENGELFYKIGVPVEEDGRWLIKYSLSLKSKLDRELLKSRGINLSTTVIEDIDLIDL